MDVAQSVAGFTRPGAWDVGRYAVGLVSSAALKRVYQLCLYSPHWRVGWRFVDDGGVWARRSLDGVPWNSIADPGYRFYADPFPMSFQGKTFVFVEDFDHHAGKGVISAIPFGDAGQIGPAEPILSEPWHLSYPYLFEHRGEVWMISSGELAIAQNFTLSRRSVSVAGSAIAISSKTSKQATRALFNSKVSGGCLQRFATN